MFSSQELDKVQVSNKKPVETDVLTMICDAVWLKTETFKHFKQQGALMLLHSGVFMLPSGDSTLPVVVNMSDE